MSRFGAIDLAAYPLPDLLEQLDAEAYLSRNKDLFRAAWDAIRENRPPIDTLALEHEPVTAQLRVAAELERMLRGHVNDRIKQVTLAGAHGRQLDHIGMTYFGGLIRRVVAPATDTAPEVLEDDETFRQRIALSPESWSTCGPEGAYLFWAVSASGDVLDAAAWSEDEGVCLAPNVRVVVLARPGMNQPEASLRAVVQEALNRRERRPIGDRVAVESASALPFDVAVTLKVREGVSPASVVAAAEARLRAYCEGRRRAIGEGIEGPIWLVGRTLYRDSIAGRAYGDDPNIVEVVVTSPVADVNAPAAGYAAGLASVGSEGFEPLAPELTAHLFRAPRLQSLTVTAEPASGGTFA